MTQTVAIRITLITSFTLLLCNSIVWADDSVPADAKNRSVSVNISDTVATSTNEMSAEKKADKSASGKKQTSSETPQARPGERVTNPDHLILNPDTTLGGGEFNGPGINDYGYAGPGDMRTHLWNAHSKELIKNGITENKLMAMAVPEVQKWHNHFHGVEGSPEHPHDDHEQSDSSSLTEQSATTASPIYGGESVDGTIISGTIIYENSEYDNSGYPQPVYGESETFYEPGVIIQDSFPYEFETQMGSQIFIP